MVKVTLLKYTSDYAPPPLKILPCLSCYERCKPESTGRDQQDPHTRVSQTHFLPCALLSFLQSYWAHRFSDMPNIFTPLTSDQNPLLSNVPMTHSLTSFKSLLNHHHLNRQPCPTYLKLYFTPSPHTPSYLLTFQIVFIFMPFISLLH